MTVVVMSNTAMEDMAMTGLKERYGSSILITIHSVGKPNAFVIKTTKNGILDVLDLEFNDTEEDTIVSGAMSDDDAIKIVDFINIYKDSIDTLFVTCEDGTYRSSGCALAISERLNAKFDKSCGDSVNILCYNKILRAFGSDNENNSEELTYIKLADDIMEGISSGKLSADNTTLPTIEELAEALDLSIRNVGLAYNLLADTGRIKLDKNRYRVNNKASQSNDNDKVYKDIEKKLRDALDIAKSNGILPTDVINILCRLVYGI